jgi:hypothetical protein
MFYYVHDTYKDYSYCLRRLKYVFTEYTRISIKDSDCCVEHIFRALSTMSRYFYLRH